MKQFTPYQCENLYLFYRNIFFKFYLRKYANLEGFYLSGRTFARGLLPLLAQYVVILHLYHHITHFKGNVHNLP